MKGKLTAHVRFRKEKEIACKPACYVYIIRVLGIFINENMFQCMYVCGTYVHTTVIVLTQIVDTSLNFHMYLHCLMIENNLCV